MGEGGGGTGDGRRAAGDGAMARHPEARSAERIAFAPRP